MSKFLVIIISIMLPSCASTLIPYKYEPTSVVTEQNYAKEKSSKGLIYLAMSGKRSWACGDYENAELRSIGFNLITNNKTINPSPDLVINNSTQGFMNYVYLLEPGTYAISYINIKVARSVSDVGYITADSSTLLSSGSNMGTFEVTKGGAAYIGHFALDCAYGPRLWRFYPQEKTSFNEYLSGYKSVYPFLNNADVSFNLFSTNEFGNDYKLK